MIKQLEHKFTIVLLTVFTVMFAIICIFIFVSTSAGNKFRQRELMNRIAAGDGMPFRKDADDFSPDKGLAYNTENHNPGNAVRETFIIVKLTNENEITEINQTSRQKIVSDDEIKEYTIEALSRKQDTGNIDDWEYIISKKHYGKIIVFLDSAIERNIMGKFIRSTIIAYILSIIPFFIISLMLSRWIVRPVKDSFQRQKQFISDSSHELKTPLTVIGANSDVLESEIGRNKWLLVIKSEVSRMNRLVNDMLSLAKAEDTKLDIELNEFDLSSCALRMALSFESVAFEENKQYSIEIEENILFRGEEEYIKQLVSILIDNAIKNCNISGNINVSLYKENDCIVLSVFNTGELIDETEKEKIFERFYRRDQARARSNNSESFGLGLSIAKAVVERHHGKIEVENRKDGVEFIVTLNRYPK